MLAAQGLDRVPARSAVKTDVLEAIRRMCVLQIDTIHVVARSPYLVLWSRLGDYRPEWLDELLAEGALFEFWSHAMCFLPIEDYPIYRRLMLDAVDKKNWPVKWSVKWMQEHPEVVDRVRSHLHEKGAVRSAEFENKNRPPGGWWNWKEEKDALESMFLTGEIMVVRRQSFQRVYDLRERVLPGWDDSDIPSSEDVLRALALRSVTALGIALPAWVPDYFRQPKTGNLERLERLAAEGLLLRVEVEGFAGHAFVHPDQLPLLEEAAAGSREPVLTTILSPFDPLVWDRQRARELFDFDYTIECYTPAPKRR
ncbi:MAG TPA: crosslink repair DNA glycosylase YcaQ family protein, partial [Anaerolineales bacterium]|nr:crosslink repair DNA glycosylase YcaQ family protein [Anaerolineales bacterium]